MKPELSAPTPRPEGCSAGILPCRETAAHTGHHWSGKVAPHWCPGVEAVTRELTFTFEVTTTLGPNDEVVPSMRYVGDWLNDNNYGYRQIGEPVLMSQS